MWQEEKANHYFTKEKNIVSFHFSDNIIFRDLQEQQFKNYTNIKASIFTLAGISIISVKDL